MKENAPSTQAPQNRVSTADSLAVLADTLRLRVLRLVEAAELSVGEVGQVLQLPQSTASRHLKSLSDAGWVARRNEGPASFYRLVPDELSPVSRGVWAAVRESAVTQGDAAEDSRRLTAVLAQRRMDSETFFGRVGADWSVLRGQLFGDTFTAGALLGLLPSDWTVADLGCGTGEAAEVLAPVVRRVLAIDQSSSMLDAAKERLVGAKNVEYVEARLEELPLPASSVDAAVMVLVLHHMPEPVRVLREARRIVKPGGPVVVVDMVRHDRSDYRQSMGHRHLGFADANTSELFAAAGWGSSMYRELPRLVEAKGPGLFAAVGR